MKDEIKEINIKMPGQILDYVDTKEHLIELFNYITNLQEENTKLKELCDKYEEEHNNAFKLWTMKMEEMPDYEERMNYKSRIERLNNIIDNIEKYFENELNDFKKVKVMNLQEPTELLKLYVDVIKELKGDNK